MTDDPTSPDDVCRNCPHPQSQHVMLNFTGEVRDGGIMLCPAPRCPCYSLWSWGRSSDPPTNLPTQAEIQQMREDIQAGRA